jgi:transposase-like protein
MGTKEVIMEIKYAAMFASVQAGGESVTEVCARLGISRKSYYKYLSRFRSEGLEGLRPRSRRPLRNPTVTPPQMVELIIKVRIELAAEGGITGRCRSSIGCCETVSSRRYGERFIGC